MRATLCPFPCLILSASARAQQCPVPGAYAAEGNGGQYIFVDPVHDSINIITADPNSDGDDFGPARTLINPAMH